MLMTFFSRPVFLLRNGLLTASVVMFSSCAFAQTTVAATAPDHAASYYHYGLAKMYENQAVQSGRQDLATQAIEQYKMALDADPDSKALMDGLANLYFNLGRLWREAVSAAQEQVAKHPEDIEAHTLAGADVSAIAGQWRRAAVQ